MPCLVIFDRAFQWKAGRRIFVRHGSPPNTGVVLRKNYLHVLVWLH